MSIWKIDKLTKLKGLPQTNIEKILKKYGKSIKHNIPDYFLISKIKIEYKKNKFEFTVYGKKINEFKYFIFKSDVEEIDSTEFSVGYIDPITNKYNKYYAYLDLLKKNKYSGTTNIKLIEKICTIIGIKRIYLWDASTIECKDPDDPNNKRMISLKFLKLIENGISWYQKLGYKLNFDIAQGHLSVSNKKKAQKLYKQSLDKLRNIKLIDLYKEFTNINYLSSKIIKEDGYSKTFSSTHELYGKDEGIFPSKNYTKIIKDIVLELNEISIKIIKIFDTIFENNPDIKNSTLKVFLPEYYKFDCNKYIELFNLLFENKIYDWYYTANTMSITYKNKKADVSYIYYLHNIRHINNYFKLYKNL